MRLSTFFISAVFVLAGTSTALPIARKNMLVARFADSDFLAEVEARAYDMGPELYTRADSSPSSHKNSHPASSKSSLDLHDLFEPQPQPSGSGGSGPPTSKKTVKTKTQTQTVSGLVTSPPLSRSGSGDSGYFPDSPASSYGTPESSSRPRSPSSENSYYTAPAAPPSSRSASSSSSSSHSPSHGSTKPTSSHAPRRRRSLYEPLK